MTLHSYKQYMDCICPKCEEIHKCRIFWTGRGIPQVFCSTCRIIADRGHVEPHKVNNKVVKKLLSNEVIKI